MRNAGFVYVSDLCWFANVNHNSRDSVVLLSFYSELFVKKNCLQLCVYTFNVFTYNSVL